ncbi:hypothetical protein HYY71_00565 [Candidatus Woesearchaeota archaeon]|nr:hypothetical protein [Candidatus Woesearchaeota archaeon]
MTDISELFFKREHFPFTIREATTARGVKFLDIKNINLPPYHPLMREQGINFELAISVLGEAIHYTSLDLQEIAETIPESGYKQTLEHLIRDINGVIVYGEPIKEDERVKVPDFPFLHGGHLYIGRDHIMPGEYSSRITIVGNIGATILVPDTVTFSEGLMKEYKIREGRSHTQSLKQFESPYGWHKHNLYTDVQKIFCKNLVIALNNAVVRAKYSA